MIRWKVVAPLAALALSVGITALVGNDHTTASAGVDPVQSTVPLEQAPPESAAAALAVTKVPLSKTYSVGMQGDEVKTIQQRLLDLHFDPGDPDGIFGEKTQQAVWAFRLLVMDAKPGANLSSAVTAEVWDRMQDPLGWTPQRTGDTSTHLEVFLDKQVAVVVTDGYARLVTHISSGSGKEWCNARRSAPDETTTTLAPGQKPTLYCNKSITPAGKYRFRLKYPGMFQGYYGDLVNPVFFNGGIAVHGFDPVPPYPASHGCIRIPNHIAAYFQSLVHVNDQVYVFDGVNDPDQLGAVPSPADSIETTTTVKGATTTAASTTVPATTVKPGSPPTATTTATTTTKSPSTTTSATTAKPGGTTIGPSPTTAGPTTT